MTTSKHSVKSSQGGRTSQRVTLFYSVSPNCMHSNSLQSIWNHQTEMGNRVPQGERIWDFIGFNLIKQLKKRKKAQKKRSKMEKTPKKNL
jgi:hypothetical protein